MKRVQSWKKKLTDEINSWFNWSGSRSYVVSLGSREEEWDAMSEHGAYILEDRWGQATFLTTRCFVQQAGLELKSSLLHPLEHLSTDMDYHG